MSTVLPNHVLKLMSPEDRKKLGKAGVTSEEASAKQEARSEKELQDQICAYLTLRGVKRIVRSRFDKPTRQAAGNPDLLFAYRGRPYAFEVKLKTGRIADEQKRAIREFQDDGWYSRVICSVDDVIWHLDHPL